MELKPGYKQTEAGVIPEDWDVYPLSDHFHIFAGGDAPKHSLSQHRTKTCPHPIFSNSLREAGLYGFTGEKRAKGDSLTITGRGQLGHAEYREEDFFPIVRLVALEPCGDLDARFTTFSVNQTVEFAIESTGVPQLTAPQVGKFLIPAPQINEQRDIARALADVDTFLISLEKLIQKKKAVKQAAMQELLTGKRRMPGFAGEWEVKRLGEIATIDPENLGSNTQPNYRFNYISLEDVDQGSLLNWTEREFSSAPSRARRRLRPNYVLVSTVRPNLKSHLLFSQDNGEWVCSTGFATLRCNGDLADPSYVYFHLFGDLINKQIESLLTGSNYPAISSRDVRNLEIPAPVLPEQKEIASILRSMESEVSSLTQRLEKTRALKQGMMQQLLTGKIRLI